jgi:hypothetical protein
VVKEYTPKNKWMGYLSHLSARADKPSWELLITNYPGWNSKQHFLLTKTSNFGVWKLSWKLFRVHQIVRTRKHEPRRRGCPGARAPNERFQEVPSTHWTFLTYRLQLNLFPYIILTNRCRY